MFDFVCCDASGVAITNLYQWDTNIYLYVNDWKNGTPTVHFCNKNSDAVIPIPSTLEDGKLKVKIPNILLQEASILSAYFYLGDKDGGMRTVYEVQIPVRKRLKPEDYEYEEDSGIDLVITQSLLNMNNRITNIENSSASVKSELENIRIGADGTTYQTAGEAVRRQLEKKYELPQGGNLNDIFVSDGRNGGVWKTIQDLIISGDEVSY